MNWLRLKSLIIKEFLSILRSPTALFILLVPPLVQILIFSHAATLDVRNVTIISLNEDSGTHSRDIINRIAASSPTVKDILPTNKQEELVADIEQQKALAAIKFPADFSKNINTNQPTNIYILLDGRRLNSAQVLAGYLQQIISTYNAELAAKQQIKQPTIEIIVRKWFNPNQNFKWFMIPNLVDSIVLLLTITITVLSISREREQGTFDQLLVSPLSRAEILLGKLIPPILVGLFQLLVFTLLANYLFSIPFHGSFWLLLLSGLCFIASVGAIGLLLSTLCKTQQQSIVTAFLFLAPVMLLSGSISPIDNMPSWLQPFTYISPLRYFLVINRGILLKDIGSGEVLLLTIPLLIISLVALSIAALFFKQRMK